MNVSTAVEGYLAVQNHLNFKSLTSYETCLKRLVEFCGDKDIGDLDRRTLAQFRQWMQTKWQSGTIEFTVSVVKVFLNFANDEKWTHLKSSAIKRKRAVKKPKDFVRVEEFELMLARANSLRDKAIVSVLWDTGLRVSELCDLHRNNLIPMGALVERRKTMAIQAVYWLPETEYLIHELIDTHEQGFIFISQGGKRKLSPRAIQRLIKKLLPERPDVTPHKLRHSKAYYMLHLGGSLAHVKNQLGHTSIETTANHYEVWCNDIQRKESLRFAVPRSIVKGNARITNKSQSRSKAAQGLSQPKVVARGSSGSIRNQHVHDVP